MMSDAELLMVFLPHIYKRFQVEEALLPALLILFDNTLEGLGTILNVFGEEEHIKNYP